MTEADWLASVEPGPMMAYLRTRVTEWKWQLFSCAIARRFHTMLANVGPAVLGSPWGEYASNLASRCQPEALAQVEARADDGVNSQSTPTFINLFNRAVGGQWLIGTTEYRFAAFAEDVVAWSLDRFRTFTTLEDVERSAQSDLLRHMFGNPFRPYPTPASWPVFVVDLAQQLYDGADVRPILHDALLDAGHAELAEHFRAEEWHPKGCWILDLVLGRG